MTREQYQHNLDDLKRYITEMGEKSHQAVADSMQSLNSLDMGLAEKVIQSDEVIDEYELKVERCATQLIARQNPTAGDMRLVTSCIKIAIDLERMSDLAVDIATMAKCLEEKRTTPFSKVQEMGEIGEDMLEQAIKAFETLDENLARSTALKDDMIDKLFHETQNELIEMMIEERTMISDASYLLYVLRYLERIGDHACNICESVVYIASGERVDLN